MKTYTYEEFTRLLGDCFDEPYLHISVFEKGDIYLYVETSISKLTYKGLVKLTQKLGTENIDVNSWSTNYQYSEYTFDSGDGLEFRFKVDEVAIV